MKSNESDTNNLDTDNEILNKYIDFTKFINNNINSKIKFNLDNKYILDLLKNFYKSIKENKKFKRYLLENKIKLFYSDNIKFSNEINIKNIYEKLDLNKKKELWTFLKLFYILSSDNDDNFAVKLIDNLEQDLDIVNEKK